MDHPYKCQKGVMEKCPENKPGGKCEGTYIGDDCWCAKRNQQYMPESERDLLKRYRATGLEPTEITAEQPSCVFYCNRRCNLDGNWCAEGPGCPHDLAKDQAAHIFDLLAAEKDGRLWISPIPLVEGTKLFCPRKDDVQEQTVQYITLLDGEPSIAVSFDCDYECNGCPHRAPYTNYEAGDGGCDGEGGYGLLLLSQIGKTVFLIRAEAEAAMGKEQE